MIASKEYTNFYLDEAGLLRKRFRANYQFQVRTIRKSFVSHFVLTIFQRLRQVVQKTLEDNGIDSNHPFYEPCTERLYSLCKSFLKVSLLPSLLVASTSTSKWATPYM